MGKLRDALLREAEEDGKKQLTEIVGQNNEERRGRFSEACQQSGANLARSEFAKAQSDLRSNPGSIRTPQGEHEFRQAYPAVPASWLDALIREHRA